MNVLAIGAHFDDIELGCGGTIAKHVANGDNVLAFVATDSGYKAPNNEIVRTNEIALSEGKNAMEILNVKLYCGHFPTLEVEFNEDLNIKILDIIENNEIDIVYTHWIGDIHHDHQVLARSSLHCARHIKRILMYRSNWYHSSFEFRDNFYVDITNYWDKKVEAIYAHKSELKRTHEKWLKFFRNEAEIAGQRIGVPLAEVFEVVKWLQ